MPPKKNKKSSGRNGFWQFVMETRSKARCSMEEAQNIAAQKWANMNKEARAPYEHLAGLARNNVNVGRCTSDGTEVQDIERREQRSAEAHQNMKEEISSEITNYCMDNSLVERVFLIIHINHLTQAKGKFYICEIGVIAFSLQKGVLDVFHSIVKPGKLPLGYYGAAFSHSQETHHLCESVQIEPFDNNTEEVFDNLIAFMRRFSEDLKLPKLYATDKIVPMIQSVFDTFSGEFGFEEEITIYFVQYLFHYLRNAAAGQTVWQSYTFCFTEMQKDTFCFEAGLSCQFHDNSDLSTYCSRSIAQRQAFTICSQCCPDLKIDLQGGKHIPQGPKSSPDLKHSPAASSSREHDAMSDYASARSSKSFRVKDDDQTSTAASVVSFSSMKSSKNFANTTKAASRIEQSLRNVGEDRSERRNLKLPIQGAKKSRPEREY